jgi:phage baseplate assembly protein W
MVTESSFLGRGIRFPLAVDHTGAVALTAGVDSIETGMRMILATAPGERAMRPDFGCAIWDLLFEPINTNTLGLMGEAAREALSRWEPRIEVDDIDVDPDESAQGAVRIAVAYTVRSTNDRRNLVFPFYVIPGEGDERDAPSPDTSPT